MFLATPFLRGYWEMRREKSKLAYYIIALALVLAVGFVVLHEIPLQPEHVEEVIQ